MRRFLDVMKVSAVGAILLSALAACNSKPESNPTPPESDQVEVIIEQVVDGKVVDTRAVGRTDVVKYTGKTNGSDLVQLKWPGKVKKGDFVKITAYAKPNLYLQEIKYRYSQSEERKQSPSSANVRGDTYNASRPLTAVNENSPVLIPTKDAKNNRVYVSLEYKKTEGSLSVGEFPTIPTIKFIKYEPRYTGDPWDDREEEIWETESLDFVANQNRYHNSKAYKDYQSIASTNYSGHILSVYAFLKETITYLQAQLAVHKSDNAYYELENPMGPDITDELARYQRIFESGGWGIDWNREYVSSKYYTESWYATKPK